MREFVSLTRGGQLRRLRRLGRTALQRYDVGDARLITLGYAENATFRVDTGDARYMLRLNRPHVHTASAIESEMAWLAALRRDTSLGVPEPVTATDGSVVVAVHGPAVPDPRLCVLLRWLGGRFTARPASVHLARVGTLTARLHTHASGWVPPPWFARPRLDTVTDAAKADALTAEVAARPGRHPSPEDGERAAALVRSLVSTADGAIVERALAVVRTAISELGSTDDVFGLIHGDLHLENVLFRGSEARAIDFDDCGWGHHAYDLAVTLSELRAEPRYDELQDALLGAYAAERSLPAGFVTHLPRLFALRELQILAWILESRERASFREHWQRWAREVLDELASTLRAAEH